MINRPICIQYKLYDYVMKIVAYREQYRYKRCVQLEISSNKYSTFCCWPSEKSWYLDNPFRLSFCLTSLSTIKRRLIQMYIIEWVSWPYSSPVLLFGCLLSQLVYCMGEPSVATYSPFIFAMFSQVLSPNSFKAQMNSFSSSFKNFEEFFGFQK